MKQTKAVIGAKMAALADDANCALLLLQRLAHKNEFVTRSTPPENEAPICMSQQSSLEGERSSSERETVHLTATISATK